MMTTAEGLEIFATFFFVPGFPLILASTLGLPHSLSKIASNLGKAKNSPFLNYLAVLDFLCFNF